MLTVVKLFDIFALMYLPYFQVCGCFGFGFFLIDLAVLQKYIFEMKNVENYSYPHCERQAR